MAYETSIARQVQALPMHIYPALSYATIISAITNTSSWRYKPFKLHFCNLSVMLHLLYGRVPSDESYLSLTQKQIQHIYHSCGFE